MRAVIQVVTHASVCVGGETIGEITKPGLMVLLAATDGDGEAQCAWMARKIADLRLMRDEQSVVEAGGEVLLVSQFTLYGEAKKGRRPSWSKAAKGEVAEPLVARVGQLLAERGIRVAGGKFGADMQVALVNDGPVTLILDTPQSL